MEKLFETNRLEIREFSLEDVEAVHEYASKGEVVQYQVWGPNQKEDTINFLKKSINQKGKFPRLVTMK